MDMLQFRIYQAVAEARRQGYDLRDLCFVMRPESAKALTKAGYILPLPILIDPAIPQALTDNGAFQSHFYVAHR